MLFYFVVGVDVRAVQMKSAAKARQAEKMAEQQKALRARAETAQRQRLAAAAAKKASRERQAEAKVIMAG